MYSFTDYKLENRIAIYFTLVRVKVAANRMAVVILVFCELSVEEIDNFFIRFLASFTIL